MADDLVLPGPFQRRRSLTDVRTFLRSVLVAWPAAGLVFGIAAYFLGWEYWAGPIWAAATAPLSSMPSGPCVADLKRAPPASRLRPNAQPHDAITRVRGRIFAKIP